MRVLILGGTGEARALACLLVGSTRDPGEVISSLAGRVAEPSLPPGQVRIGGFGGAEGLLRYLRDERIAAMIDATHPFAARISEHAALAGERAGIPLLALRRPGWTAGPGDRWHRVATPAEAADAVAQAPPGTVLLTTGRSGVAAFAPDAGHRYLIRTVQAPEGPLPPRHTLLLDRGPFALDAELALLRDHRVTLLVTKDSGGESTAAKLAAARELALPVVMLDRPPSLPGLTTVTTAQAAARWWHTRTR